jgi:hypothetical protein
MAMFRGVYPSEAIQRDQEYAEGVVRQGERRQSPRRQLAGETPERLKATGERMEMLKTVVFDKFLGKNFVVVRSARYDDVANKIDNVILDRKTGNLVCAFDEVGESSGPKYERKKDEVLRRDREKGGGTLKYGLRIERDNRLVKDKVENVPIFYLALPKELIDETIEQLDPSAKKPSRREKQLFAYFNASLYSQIQLLNMDTNLNPVLTDRIKNFKRILEGLQEKK